MDINENLVPKDVLCKALREEGFIESAILLEVWGYEDELAKSKKQDVWHQTVAFLAAHDKSPGWQKIHSDIKAKEQPAAAAAEGHPKPPKDMPGQEGQVTHVKGKIRNKRTGYPTGGRNEDGSDEYKHRWVSVQDKHRYVHRNGSWVHDGVTTSGEGLNAKEQKKRTTETT